MVDFGAIRADYTVIRVVLRARERDHLGVRGNIKCCMDNSEVAIAQVDVN